MGGVLPSSTMTATTGTPCSCNDCTVFTSRPSSLNTGMSTATVPGSHAAPSSTCSSAGHAPLQSINQPEDRIDAAELNDADNEVRPNEDEQRITKARREKTPSDHCREHEQGEQTGQPGLDRVLQVDVVKVVLGDVDAEDAPE